MSTRLARKLAPALSVLVALSATFALAPPASAAAPSNDNRVNATKVRPPDSLTGTLVEATLEATNDSSSCAGTDSSVWYRFTAPARGAVVVQLDANGQMDATVDVYRQVRSKLTFVDCNSTDAAGSTTLEDAGLVPGADYAIRVGNQTGSVADTFQLKVLVPTAPPEPPGRHLPDQGIKNRVDRVLNPGDAYWTRLHAGTTMRLSLTTDHCTSLEVFGPGTTDFESTAPLKRLPCGGYSLFTPTRTGRHFLVVRAARGRDVQHYRLQVAPARLDDTTPGVLIHNHAVVRGHVNGGIDTRDLYRFDVTRLSALTLSLSGAPTMTLVRDDGVRIGSGNLISGHIRAGRYFVAVEGDGGYRLGLALKTITHAAILANGRHVATVAPGATARLLLRVHPAVAGPSLITIERLDPIQGWQFLRTFDPRVSSGRALVRFHPPTVGRYRMRAVYLGTRDAAPSTTGLARLLVQQPLSPRNLLAP
ncbi:hypothetical protein [Nocardioides cynanchi]|uniref:hypothetical protein n=1 Tax=Nocardioides cynanchi TaxID=2558918 RepID=UPI001244EDB0|nr:hypothetical protein [Nocardioides cynanchi]